MLGVVGLGLRLAISTQPSLEVGAGLPTWASALYIALGTWVAIWGVRSTLELRSQPRLDDPGCGIPRLLKATNGLLATTATWPNRRGVGRSHRGTGPGGVGASI